jgi:hypothetical protein
MPKTPVLIYDLNLGGGLVNFTGEPPAAATLVLRSTSRTKAGLP